VIDTGTNTEITIIPLAPGAIPFEVAISPDGSRAYVASNLNHTVTVINIRTNEVMTEIPTGGQPVSVDVTLDNRRVYVAI
jgi:YVTN family beta-propeller protein